MNTTIPKSQLESTDLEQLWPQLQLDELTPALQSEADLIVDGVVVFRFHGEHPTRVGRQNIDWSGAHRDHQEWPAQLNRFYTLRVLAAAWHGTRDDKYAQAAHDYIEDWMRAHRVCADWLLQKGDSTLNLPIRVGNSHFPGWGGTLDIFSDSAVFNDEFRARVLESIETQLNFLIEHFSAGGNWRIAQADALVATAVRWPQLTSAERWCQRGVEVINEAASQQFLPDGVHIERTPSYHAWMTRVMHSYWRLARVLPELGLEIDTAKLHRSYQYWLASTRPNGHTNRLHDTQWRLPRWDAREPFAKFVREAGLEDAKPARPSQYFPYAGQALLRTDRTANSDYVTFDATPLSGGHWHLSINALQVDVMGKPILVDPGILDYERGNPLMAYGKSTRAHNTINFNGWNQAPVSHIKTEYSGTDGYDFVSGDYDGGYWPSEYQWRYQSGLQNGLWARHQRMVFWAHGRYILVKDTLFQRPADAPFVECNWQFDNVAVELHAERAEVVTRNQDANLLLRVLDKPQDTSLHLLSGETEPLRGWIDGGQGVVAAPQLAVRCATLTENLSQFVTLLVPFEGATPPQVQAEIVAGSEGRVIQVQSGQDTDTICLNETPFLFAQDEIRFEGTAGVLHRRDGQSHLWLAQPGRLSSGDQSVEVAHPLP